MSSQCSLLTALIILVIIKQIVADDWDDTTMFSYLDSRDKTAVVSKRMKYFTRDGESCLFHIVFLIYFFFDEAIL